MKCYNLFLIVGRLTFGNKRKDETVGSRRGLVKTTTRQNIDFGLLDDDDDDDNEKENDNNSDEDDDDDENTTTNNNNNNNNNDENDSNHNNSLHNDFASTKKRKLLSILPLDKTFSPVSFLTMIHGEMSFEDLKGIQTLFCSILNLMNYFISCCIVLYCIIF